MEIGKLTEQVKCCVDSPPTDMFYERGDSPTRWVLSMACLEFVLRKQAQTVGIWMENVGIQVKQFSANYQHGNTVNKQTQLW